MTVRVAALVLALAALQSAAALQRWMTAIHALGIPLEVGIHVDVAADWRHADARMSTYIVGDFLRLTYREASELAQPGGDATERRTGALSLAGIDVALSRWVRVGGELRFRRHDYRSIRGLNGNGFRSSRL
jgi:hypothetical protein